MPNDNTTPPSNQASIDEQTALRFQNLAIVGTALVERSNSSNFQTDYFLAKDALQKFKGAVETLPLDPKSMQGMHDLIGYLEKKIDKRMNSSMTLQPLA